MRDCNREMDGSASWGVQRAKGKGKGGEIKKQLLCALIAGGKGRSLLLRLRACVPRSLTTCFVARVASQLQSAEAGTVLHRPHAQI